MPRLNEEDKAEPVYAGPWTILRRVENAYCVDDGHRRVAVPTGDADTFYTIPARITVYCRVKHKNVAVTGHLSKNERADGVDDWAFHANPNSKNAYVFDSNKTEGA